MTRGILRSALALVLMAGTGGTGASPQADKLEQFFRQSPSAADYPGASAVVVLAEKTMLWLDAEARLTEDIRSLTKILSDRGRERFGEYRIFYRRGEQQVNLLRAGTHRGPGDFATVEAEAVRDFPVVDGPEAGLYQDVMVKAVPLPAVAVNTILETRVERITESRPDGFSGIEYFQSDEPLREKHLRLIVPKGRPLAWKLPQGGAVQLVRSAERGMDLYSFYASDSPRIADEPASPPLAGMAARLVFSAYPDWPAAVRPFAEAYWDRIRQCPQVRAFTAELLAGSKDDAERLERIYAFVSRSVGSVPLGLQLSGYAPHPPDEILDKRGGDAKDKAILAGAMLAAAGFEARPIFLSSQYLPVEEEVPALEQFDSIVLRIALPGGETVILDPFSPAGSLGWCIFAPGNRGLEVRPDGCAFTEIVLPAGAESTARNRFRIRLQADGSAQAAAESALQGAFAATARRVLGEWSPGALQAFYEKSARAVSPGAASVGGRSDHLKDTGREVALELHFETEQMGVRQGDILILDVPAFPLPLAEATMYLGLASRANPLLLGPPAASLTRTEIRLPEGAEILHLPPDLSRAEPEWAARRTFRHDAAAGTILVEAEVRLLRHILPVEAYPRAREFFGRWLDRRNQLVILRAPAGAGAIATPPGGGKGK